MIISDSIFHMFWISGNIYAHNTCFKQRNLSGLIIFCWIIGTWNQKHNLTISLTDKPYPSKELTTYSICWWEVQMPSPSPHNTCFKQRNLSGLIIFCWIIGTWNQKHNLTISLTDKPYPSKELTTYSICWWEVQMPSPSAPPPPLCMLFLSIETHCFDLVFSSSFYLNDYN